MNYKSKDLSEWLRSNKLSLNSGKSTLVIFHSKTKKEPDEKTLKINKFLQYKMLIILASFLTNFFSGMFT